MQDNFFARGMEEWNSKPVPRWWGLGTPCLIGGDCDTWPLWWILGTPGLLGGDWVHLASRRQVHIVSALVSCCFPVSYSNIEDYKFSSYDITVPL